jgi:hypothetical protein
MSEVNNDKDGGGDPNNGTGNIDGVNVMDMDAKGVDEEATSNNNGQDENVSKSGVEGMQEQCQQVDEIQIGTLKVQLSPIGTVSFDPNLAENKFYKPIFHVQNLALSNKKYTEFNADMLAGRSVSRLPGDRARATSAGTLSAGSRCMQSNHSCDAAADSERQRLHQPAASLGVVAATAEVPAAPCMQHVAPKTPSGPLRANGFQGTRMVGAVGNHWHGDTGPRAGSVAATPAAATPAAGTPASLSSATQKIQPAADAATTTEHGDRSNHWPLDEPMMRLVLENLGGSSVHGIDVGNGVFYNKPNFIDKSIDFGLCMCCWRVRQLLVTVKHTSVGNPKRKV